MSRADAPQNRQTTHAPANVLFSGLDSDTSLTKLCQLTNEFPQIEFGVNYDLDRQGRPGFPVLDAIERAVDVLPNMAIHLSGSRTLCAFLDSVNGPEIRNLCRRFRRVQLTVPAEVFNSSAPTWRVATMLNLLGMQHCLEISSDSDVSSDAALEWSLNHTARAVRHTLLHQDACGEWSRSGCLFENIRHHGYCYTDAGVSGLPVLINQLDGLREYWLEVREGVRKDNKFSAGLALEFMKKLYPENRS